MARQFVDPLDEEADAAGAEAVSKYGGKLKERLTVADDDTEEVTPQDEPEDEEAEEVADAQLSRREKRASRSTARERAAAAEARATVLEEQLAISRRSAVERAAPPPQGNQVAAIDSRIKNVFKRQEALFEENNRRGLSEARRESIRQEAEALEIEKVTLAVERRDALLEPQRRRAAQADALAARAPDVYANENAMRFAQGYYNQQLALGKADTIELHDEAMQVAREAVLGKRPKPDAGQRQRASGIGGGPRAGSGDGDKPVISMTKGSPLWRMAVARYPDLEPAQACQKWVNKNGKEYAARLNARK